MKNTKLKKICALALTLALGVSVLTGCGSKGSGEPGTVIYNIGEDPQTVDPQLNESANGGNIITNSFEGLTRMDKDGKPQPAVAESWEISADGKVYTFKLRDSKWSDGQPVAAKDFKYSWLRALNPETGASYASKLYYIKGAEEYNLKGGKAEDVAIEVVDEKTLKVELVNPTSYFLELTAFPTYMPVREDIVTANGDAWATKPETYVSNGPFKMTEWRMKDAIILEKNENYWNAEAVKLNKIDIRMVAEDTTSYAEFKAGNFDMIEQVPPAEVENALNEKHAEVFTEYATYFLAMNVGNNVDKFSPEAQKALKNTKFRKALSLAVDRVGLVEQVTKMHQEPAYSFVPPGTPMPNGEDFANKKYIDTKPNVEEAKKMLAEAGYPDGKGLPTFNFLINSEGSHAAVAQYLQSAWKEIGVNVEIQQQEFKVFQTTRQNGEYMIGRHGWSGDYTDPTTFLDMWRKGDGFNEVGYDNPEYDKLLKEAQKETDAAKRFELLRKAEDLLMEDLPVIPLYYYTKVRAINSGLKGVIISPTGDVDFVNAYKE